MHMLTLNFFLNQMRKQIKQQPHNSLVHKIHEPKAITIKFLVGTMQRG